MALRSDGSVAYHDAGADAFFLKYALPLLQRPDLNPTDSEFRKRLLATTSSTCVHRQQCGLIWVAMSHVEKRQPTGLLVLVACDGDLELNEDVLRICTRLSIDSQWLHKQASQLPTYTETSLQRQGKLVLATLRDQMRLGSLENELASVSEQLASTYEELSLIYQVSGGMKVNRGATDFFRQTCVEVQQVIGVRGIGVALRPDTQGKAEPVLYGELTLPPGRVLRLADDLMR